MANGSDRAIERLAVGGNEPRRKRGRGGDRDLLAEHRAQRQLLTVDVAGDAAPRHRVDEAAEDRIGAERLAYALGIAVEVEQGAAT
jgi:hypothetical protein